MDIEELQRDCVMARKPSTSIRERESLTANFLRDNMLAVESHAPEIWVVLEIEKGNSAGRLDRVIHDDRLAIVPGVPISVDHSPPKRHRTQCSE